MQLLENIKNWNDWWKIVGSIAAFLIFFSIFGEAGLFIAAGIQIGVIVGFLFFPGNNSSKTLSTQSVSEGPELDTEPQERLVFAFKMDGKILSLWEGGKCKIWNGQSWHPTAFHSSDPFSEDAESLSLDQIERITGRYWLLKE